jgi:hypothetical protein
LLAEWTAADVLYATLVSAVLGAGGGYVFGALAVRLRDANMLDRRLDFYFAVPSALVVYGSAEFLGAYGLVAAFCGDVAFRRYGFEHEHKPPRLRACRGDREVRRARGDLAARHHDHDRRAADTRRRGLAASAVAADRHPARIGDGATRARP